MLFKYYLYVYQLFVSLNYSIKFYFDMSTSIRRIHISFKLFFYNHQISGLFKTITVLPIKISISIIQRTGNASFLEKERKDIYVTTTKEKNTKDYIMFWYHSHLYPLSRENLCSAYCITGKSYVTENIPKWNCSHISISNISISQHHIFWKSLKLVKRGVIAEILLVLRQIAPRVVTGASDPPSLYHGTMAALGESGLKSFLCIFEAL